MIAPRLLIIREVQLAHMLGFTDFEPFKRALRAGDVPPPSGQVLGKPIWRVVDLESYYGTDFAGGAATESDILAKIEAL